MVDLYTRLQKIKLFVTDVDGVLTNGQIILGSNGLEMKAFNAQDGLGLNLLKKAGIKRALITGRYSEAVAKRAEELKFEYAYQGIADKQASLKEILEKENLTLEEVAYIGDDLNDLPILSLVGVKLAVNNAVAEVKKMADHVTERSGGNGAVREAVELIIKAQGKWQMVVDSYLQKTEGIQ